MDEQNTDQNQEQNQNEAPQTSPQSKKGLPLVIKFIICLLIISTIISIIAGLLSHLPYVGYTFSIIGGLSLFIAIPTAYYFTSIWEHKENPQAQSPKSADKQAARKAVAENPGRFFILSFLYFIAIVLVIAGGSLIITIEACRGQSDCGAGWGWGFFFLPVSGILALVFSPILATRTIKAQKKKEQYPYGKPAE